MNSKFEAFCAAIRQIRTNVKYHNGKFWKLFSDIHNLSPGPIIGCNDYSVIFNSDMFAFMKRTMPDGFLKKMREHYTVSFYKVHKS